MTSLPSVLKCKHTCRRQVTCLNNLLLIQSDLQSEAEDKDGPKHVFSFSWLNQK